MTPKAAAGQARRLAYAADPEAAAARARNARKDRRVSLRPAPDTMSWFGALLPVEQGVACLAALRRHADTLTAAGDGRTRAQIMADTAVERLTGQAHADDIGVEVNLVMPIDSLLDPHDPEPADLPGHGPIPAGLAHQIIAAGHGPRWWRRLFTAPTGWDGQRAVIGGDRTARRFTGALAKLINLRDGATCREPFCGAPIRHYDHIRPLAGRRPHQLHQRPRRLRTAQLHPGDARLERRAARRPSPHRDHHHSHRTQLPQPSPQPALSEAHWGRSSTAEVVSLPVKLPVQP